MLLYTTQLICIENINILPCNKGKNCVFGVYGISPENLDGSLIMYLEIDDQKNSGVIKIRSKFELITEIKLNRVSPHNGARQYWNSDDLIVFQDGFQKIILYNIIKNVVIKELSGKLGLKNRKGSILIKKDFKTRNSEPGIYKYDIKKDLEKKLISYSDIERFVCARYPDCNIIDIWNLKYSQDGELIYFRVDFKSKGVESQVLASFDGSSLIITDLIIHFMPINNFIYGGVDGKLVVLNKNLDYFSGFNIGVNHFDVLGMKIASDSHYNSELVSLKLCNIEISICRTLFINDNSDIVWNRFYHINPAFSSNGKTLYFNYPISKNSIKAAYLKL